MKRLRDITNETLNEPTGAAPLDATAGRLTSDQALTLWLGAFRYYLGRCTYAVSDFCAALISAWSDLPTDAKLLIQRELEEAFKRDDHYRAVEPDNGRFPLGRDCDRAEWENVRKLWADANK